MDNANNYTTWALGFLVIESILFGLCRKYMIKKNYFIVVFAIVSLFILFLRINIDEAKDQIIQELPTSTLAAWLSVFICISALVMHYKVPNNIVSKTLMSWNEKTSYVLGFALVVSLILIFSIKNQ